MNVVNVVPMPPSSRPSQNPAEPHVPVMTAELLQWLEPRDGGVYLDATVGAGGHARALLEAAQTTVIGLDRDPLALSLARNRLEPFGERARLVSGTFSQVESIVEGLGLERLDGLVADLGVSSMQLDDATRGMSFRLEGPLDMRMDRKHGRTALELIADVSVDELTEIVSGFGEERRARRVARCIKQAESEGKLSTTLDLRRAVVRAVGPARVGGVDPATRTFQALRIAVNDELVEVEALLRAAERLLVPGGRIAIISFHSLEDRICKRLLKRPAVWQPLTKKPIVPGERERDDNPRARSAKLRVARRVPLSAVAGEAER
ncbi:MAG: 16S rRNA (cytosine(1402)-N(4))-methyltransferase RsmH [Deltaproteobacteria bacterium]|jgi:16S rRNA (cytosine1402-N4)-methyltransferase|nr:16S rRNA (cytosine(1402)-N(4))-methyltransferase RsmH [Deltaproteobacteria bacterium]MBW2535811.1 16S rRNA (cytosine(1402)-N(4))-methyltransferase RsmH [Deltaproteobacteria bacterium]